MVNYYEHLRSKYWKKVSKRVKERDGYRCRVCNSGVDLVAHHRTYDHLGCELDHLGDITCLCGGCHEKFHVPLPRGDRVVATVMPDRKEYIMGTARSVKYLDGRKTCWHWVKNAGMNPSEAGWMKRCIGLKIPIECFRKQPQVREKFGVVY